MHLRHENFPPSGPNRGWYTNKEFDKIIAEAKVTTNVKKRKKLYEKAQELIDKDLPYVFLWHEDSFAVIRKDVKGFKIFADGRLSSLTSTYR